MNNGLSCNSQTSKGSRPRKREGALVLGCWRLARRLSYGLLNDPTCVPSSLPKTALTAEDTRLRSVFSFSSVYLSNYSPSLATLLFILLNACHIRVCYYLCCRDLSAVIKGRNRRGFLPEALVPKRNDLSRRNNKGIGLRLNLGHYSSVTDVNKA